MKKVLAISILSIGVLSSVPSALCAPSGAKNTSGTFRGNIKTIEYRPLSFDAEIFNDVLRINGIEEDLRNASRIVEVDPMSNEKTVHLCGNKWECVIKPFNGRDYRVEYIKKLEANEEINKRIIFIFNPSALFETKSIDFFRNFNDLLEDCGLRDFINVEKALKTFVVPTGITEIGGCAFEGCKSLEKIVIPNSVTEIGNFTFFGCEALEKIVIPNSVTSIGENAFFGCEALKKIKIPNSVTSIGRFAFCDCTSLKEIKIPNNVTSIDSRAFFGCKSLKKVEIPNSVTSIGDDAFAVCTSIEEIEIPNSVTSIGNVVFAGCTSLEKIEIPNSVTSIGKCAFAGCTSLSRINIPNSVTEIGNGAFDGCTSLDEIEWRGNVYHTVAEFFAAFNNRF